MYKYIELAAVLPASHLHHPFSVTMLRTVRAAKILSQKSYAVPGE